MESTGDPGHIQISEACKELLPPLYKVEQRGSISFPGKGLKTVKGGPSLAKREMNTYWLTGREARVPLSKYYSKSIVWTAPSVKTIEGMNRPAADSATLIDEADAQNAAVASNVPQGVQASSFSRSTLRDRAFSIPSTPFQRLGGIVEDHIQTKHGFQDFSSSSIPSLLQTILSVSDSEPQHPLGIKRRAACSSFAPTRKDSDRESTFTSASDEMSVMHGMSLESCPTYVQSSYASGSDQSGSQHEGKMMRNNSSPHMMQPQSKKAGSVPNASPPERKVSRIGTHHPERDASNILRSRSLSHFVTLNGCLASSSPLSVDDNMEFDTDPSEEILQSKKSSRFSSFKIFKRMKSQVSPPSPSSISGLEDHHQGHRGTSRKTSSEGSTRSRTSNSLFARSMSCEPLCSRNDVIEGHSQ